MHCGEEMKGMPVNAMAMPTMTTVLSVGNTDCPQGEVSSDEQIETFVESFWNCCHVVTTNMVT